MMRRTWLGQAAALAVLAGCASSNPALYTIKAEPGAVTRGAHRVVVLRQVGVARYLDRSQIVQSGADYKLVVSSNDWWGEPLADMLTRVLVQEVAERLPDATVASENSVVGNSPDATVEVEIRRLDGTGANEVALNAQIGVAIPNRPPRVRSVSFTVPQPTPDTRGYAAATSVAVGKVADTIVTMLPP